MNVFDLYGDVSIRGISEASNQLSGLRSLAANVGSKMKSLGSTMSNVGTKMLTFASIPIATALGYSIIQASDLNETISKTGVVFDDASDSVMKWSKTTLTEIGLAQGTALDMAATYGDMGTSMGLTTEEAANMSMAMVNLAGDMASFKNMKPEEVHTALTGVFTGETEALKSLGIVMTETNLIEYAKQKGLKKSYTEMSQAEKVQLRYNYVMDMGKNSQGDFKNTQESAANQMRIFTESIKELAAQIGTLLLPYFTKAVNWLNKLVTWFRELDPSIQGVMVKVALLVAGIGPLLIIGGALVSILGTVITFLSAVSFEVLLVVTAVTGLIAIIVGVVGSLIGWDNIMSKIKEKLALVEDLVRTLWTAIQEGRDPLAAAVEWLQNMVGKGSELSLAIGNLYASWLEFTSKVKELLADLQAKFQEAWDAIWEVVGPFFKRLQEEALPIFLDIVAEIMSLLGEMADNFKENLDLIWEAWKKIWKKIKPYVESALNLAVEVIKNALNIIKNLIKLAKAVMTGDWKTAWSSIKEIVKSAIKIILATGKTFKSNFIKVLKSLATSAKNRFKSMKSDLVNIVKSIGSLLYKAGRNLMNMLIKGINSRIETVKSLASKAAGVIKSYLGFSSPTEEGPGSDSDKWMPNMMNMFKQGIIKNIPAIKAALEEVGATIETNQPIITPGFSQELATSTTGAKTSGDVILNVNNPKVFDTNDINKFMNPVVERLRQTLKTK